MSTLPSILVLSGLAALAVRVAASRQVSPDVTARRRAARGLMLATAAQCAHFLEELATGLPEQIPALFGLPPMPMSFFLSINIAALFAWSASVPGVRAGRAIAFFAAWFLTIASIFNGIMHPAIAVVTGGYFSGLMTAPLVAIAGIHLWNRLSTATEPARLSRPPAP